MTNLSRTLLVQLTALAGIAAVTAFSAFTLAEASEVSPGKPKYCYLSDATALAAGEVVNGPARVLDLKGPQGNPSHEYPHHDQVDAWPYPE